MTDRACVLLMVLAALLVALARDAIAEVEPIGPDTVTLPTDVTVTTPDTPDELAGAIAAAVRGGRWLVVLGLVLMLVVYGIRRGFARRFPFLCTPMGGRVVAYVTAIGISVGPPLAAGHRIDVGLLVGALAMAWVSSGMNEDRKDAREAGQRATRAAT